MEAVAVVDDEGARIHWASAAGLRLAGSHAVVGWADRPPRPPVDRTTAPYGGWASLSVHDGRRLDATVDHLGTEPLYWWSSGRVTVVATTVPLLRATAEVPREACLSHLLEWAQLTFTASGETAWAGVRTVPPGHTLRVAASGTELAAYWRPHARLDNDADIAEWGRRLRDDLRSSLDRCLPPEPTAVLLSGGLDSSVVAGWATVHPARPPRLLAAVQYPGMPNDESAWQRAVADDIGLPLVTVTPRDFDPDRYLARLEATALPVLRPEPEILALYELLAGEGITQVLTGGGGDELFAPIRWGVEEMVLQRRWAALGRWWRTEGLGGIRDGVRRRFADLRPPAVEAARARRRRRPWIPDTAASHLGVRHLPPRVRPGRHATGRMRADFLVGGIAAVGAQVDAAMRRTTGIGMRHPFWDIPLIETALGIPGALLHDEDDVRALQRAAFADHLPAAIRGRRDKVHFDYRYAQHLAHPWVRDQLATSRLATADLLDRDQVLAALDEVVAAVDHDFQGLPPTVAPLWAVVGIEAWWRRYMD